jgi:hypothetical protein
MILIVTAADDEPADRVEAILRRRGASVLRFDSADYPSKARISVAFRDGALRLTLRSPGRTERLDDLSAVWFRRPGDSRAADAIEDGEVRLVVEQDAREFLNSLWDALPCRALPATPSVMTRAQRKASQMVLAQALGFEVPATAFTNDPQEFLDLYRACNGQLISKINSNLALRERMGTTFMRYTDTVSTRDVAHAQAVSLCPIVVQAHVPKRVELRITVVGRRVLAAAIHSQATRRTRVDWRRYDLSSTPHTAYDLPADVAERCARLVAESGLNYGAIDMIVTPDGRHVFLELNAAGEYSWIEQLTGLPISEAIADFLIGDAPPPVAAILPRASQEACHV